MVGKVFASILAFMLFRAFSLTGNAWGQEQKDAITIGSITALTGPFAFAGVPLSAGLKDSLMIANEAGGINGKKLRYMVEDSQYKLTLAKPAFARIMQQYKPLAVYGDTTALGEALADDIRDKFKVLYSSTSFSGSLAFVSVASSILFPARHTGISWRYSSSISLPRRREQK